MNWILIIFLAGTATQIPMPDAFTCLRALEETRAAMSKDPRGVCINKTTGEAKGVEK